MSVSRDNQFFYFEVAFCIFLLALAPGVTSIRYHALRSSHNIRKTSISMKAYSHGEGFHFLPISKAQEDEFWPRTVQIAGVYPELSVADFLAPTSTRPPSQGQWAYDFSDPDGPQLGTIAMPGSYKMNNCVDPVAMITTNVELGVKLLETCEMVVIVDRGDKSFDKEQFMLLKTPEDSLIIRCCDEIEPGHSILGKIALCAVPLVESMRDKETGFAEN